MRRVQIDSEKAGPRLATKGQDRRLDHEQDLLRLRARRATPTLQTIGWAKPRGGTPGLQSEARTQSYYSRARVWQPDSAGRG